MPLTAINAAIDALVVVPKISTVEATKVKELTVTFNGAVDSTKAVFAVKKGTTTVSVADVVWNDAKTVATLTLNSKLTEGTYTVNVTGLDTTTLTGTVAVLNEKVVEIKILSDKLLTTSATTGTVGYQVLNQYGEDITTNALASGLSYSTTASGGAADDNKGTITVTFPNTTETGDTFVLTVIDPTTAVTANKNLTVADAAAVSSVTFGDIYNEDDEVLSEDTLADDFYLIITPVDQYGTTVTDPVLANAGTMLLSSNTSVIGAPNGTIQTITIDDVDYLAVPINALAKGTSTITAVVTANGSTASKAVTIEVGTKVDTAVIGTPDGTITGSSTVNIPVELTDNKGEAVTELSDITSGTTPTVTQNSVGVASAFVKIDGQLYIQLTTNTVPTNSTHNLLVTVATSTGNLASKVFTVKPDSVPTTLVALSSSVAKSVLQGQSLVINDSDFTVEDQYGNAITDVAKYQVIGAPVDGTKGITVTNDTANSKLSVNASATATTDTVTFTLRDAAGVATTSTIDAKFSGVATSTFTSYKVENFGTVYAPTGANALYNAQLKVYGVTSGGKEVLLPADTGLYTVATDATYLTPSISSGKTLLTAIPDQLVADEITTKDVSAKVTINANGQELTATGVITNVKPAIATVEAVTYNTAIGLAPANLQTATLTAVTSATFAGGADFGIADLTGLADFVATDQYGVRVALIAGTFAIDDIPAVTPTLTMTTVSGTIGYASNGTNAAKMVSNTANAVFNTRLNAGTVNTTVKVTATAANNATNNAQAVIDEIAALSTSTDFAADVATARTNFDALTAYEQTLVTNVAVLEAAEDDVQELADAKTDAAALTAADYTAASWLSVTNALALDETTQAEVNTKTAAINTAIANLDKLVKTITVTGAAGATTISVDNGTLQMSAAVLPVDAADQTVTWSVVAGTGTASIDGSGLLSATTNGTVTVKATANDGSLVEGTLVITISNQS